MDDGTERSELIQISVATKCMNPSLAVDNRVYCSNYYCTMYVERDLDHLTHLMLIADLYYFLFQLQFQFCVIL